MDFNMPGTTETASVSAVPTGLWSSPTLFPALKVPGYFHGVPLGRENGLNPAQNYTRERFHH
jgi:hypothetical protein